MVAVARRWSIGVSTLALGMLGAGAAVADRIELVAGGGTKSEGVATECRLDKPFACGKDRNGTLYIAEFTGRVLAVDRSGRLRRVAEITGEGNGGDNGPAVDATLKTPHHLLVLPNGDVVVADTMDRRIRRIDAKSRKIVPLAGTGVAGFGGDGGPAPAAQFGAIYCLALDQKRGLLYIDHLDNRRIRSLDMKTGIVSTVAGNGRRGVPVDGAVATEAPLVDPRAIATNCRAISTSWNATETRCGSSIGRERYEPWWAPGKRVPPPTATRKPRRCAARSISPWTETTTC